MYREKDSYIVIYKLFREIEQCKNYFIFIIIQKIYVLQENIINGKFNKYIVLNILNVRI